MNRLIWMQVNFRHSICHDFFSIKAKHDGLHVYYTYCYDNEFTVTCTGRQFSLACHKRCLKYPMHYANLQLICRSFWWQEPESKPNLALSITLSPIFLLVLELNFTCIEIRSVIILLIASLHDIINAYYIVNATKRSTKHTPNGLKGVNRTKLQEMAKGTKQKNRKNEDEKVDALV